MDQETLSGAMVALVAMERVADGIEAAAREIEDAAEELAGAAGVGRAEIAESLEGHGVPGDAARRLAAEAEVATASGDAGFARERAAAMRRISGDIRGLVREWRDRAAAVRDPLREAAAACRGGLGDMVVVSDGPPAGYDRLPRGAGCAAPGA